MYIDYVTKANAWRMRRGSTSALGITRKFLAARTGGRVLPLDPPVAKENYALNLTYAIVAKQWLRALRLR